MPCADGSVSHGTSGRNSAKQLGQPLVKISGIPWPLVPWLTDPSAHGINLGAAVAEAVQPAFLRTPVEAVCPVRQQFPQVVKVCALLPRRIRGRFWPPRAPDPALQVGEDVVTQPDPERLRPESSHTVSGR